MTSYLYILHLGTPDICLLKTLVQTLSNDAQVKISKIRNLDKKWSQLLSNILIQNVLSKELDVSIDSLKIEPDIQGKPIIINGKRHFNISYSNNIVALATDTLPIGVDVEYIQPLSDLEELIPQFTDEEQQTYYAKPNNQRTEFFYELWTLKESYLKATGKGLSCSLQSFSISVTDDEAVLSRGIDSDVAWYFQRYTFDRQYKCAVCRRTKTNIKKINIIKVADLLQQ